MFAFDQRPWNNFSDTLANRFLADVQLIASAKEEQISEGRKVRKEGRKEGSKEKNEF
jgi:hypothetical protein